MKKIIVAISIALPFIFLLMESTNLCVYEGIASDSKYYECVKRNIPNYHFMKHYPDDKDEIVNYNGSNPYIARKTTVLFKYVIQDFGLVPRWSKTANLLDNYYDSLNRVDNRQHVVEEITKYPNWCK